MAANNSTHGPGQSRGSGPSFNSGAPLTVNQALVWVPLFIFEALLIITANCLSILVFTGSKYRKKKSSLLLTNLAIADLLVGCLATGFQIHHLGAVFWGSPFDLSINVPFDMFTGFASLFSLTAIALERMCAALFPIHYKHMRILPGYVIAITLLWLLAALVPCGIYLVPRDVISIDAINYVSIFLLCLSVFLVVFSYTAIGVKMSLRSHLHQNQRHQRQRHVVQTLILVTFLSLISWLPFQVIITVLYISHGKYGQFSINVVIATKFLQFGNSFVNTIVYYLRMPGFRGELKNIVSTKIRCSSQKDRAQVGACNQPTGGTPGQEMSRLGRNGIPSTSSVATRQSTVVEETKF